ncbi:sensor histidine kinase [Bradyrhizobium sp. BR13661]|uniref:sensor histidine kinase n=1 Tax=Bradyrhizobium sp. BR13661 TaxID=2940622 RepID=UPI0024755034|nr:sensor histidine kinase [Bradyrhizobium sp. BR13661]MDH6260438.1 two-component sensor histidine kinase [Bradyrhizobium sp. BR13661]
MTLSNLDPLTRQEGILLRELHHRVANGVASAIDLVAAAAVRVEGTEAKRALSDVVDQLHGYADVHRALTMPAGDALIHAATYLRKLGCGMRRALLDRMNIQLAFATQSLALQPERCWRLGLIVHELVTHAARHSCFDARAGQVKIKLARIGSVANCVIADNGSRSARHASEREFRIIRELARALGGRIEQGFGTEFTSVVLSFPLTERERAANWTIATRQMKLPRRKQGLVSDQMKLTRSGPGPGHDSGPVARPLNSNLFCQQQGDLAVSRQVADALGGLLSPSNHTDAR